MKKFYELAIIVKVINYEKFNLIFLKIIIYYLYYIIQITHLHIASSEKWYTAFRPNVPCDWIQVQWIDFVY